MQPYQRAKGIAFEYQKNEQFFNRLNIEPMHARQTFMQMFGRFVVFRDDYDPFYMQATSRWPQTSGITMSPQQTTQKKPPPMLFDTRTYIYTEFIPHIRI